MSNVVEELRLVVESIQQELQDDEEIQEWNPYHDKAGKLTGKYYSGKRRPVVYAPPDDFPQVIAGKIKPGMSTDKIKGMLKAPKNRYCGVRARLGGGDVRCQDGEMKRPPKVGQVIKRGPRAGQKFATRFSKAFDIYYTDRKVDPTKIAQIQKDWKKYKAKSGKTKQALKVKEKLAKLRAKKAAKRAKAKSKAK